MRKRKFSRTGWGAPGILLLKNQFHDLFECLSVIGQNIIFVPNQEPACIVLPSWCSYTKEFTCKLDCFLYAPEKISLARAAEFLWEESSVNSKWAPKVYSTSFIRSSCITEEKHLTTNLQTIKGEKISPARACMTIKYAEQTENNHADDFAWTSLEVLRLQNSPYFCVFKYARAVKQKVWNKAENRERDWGETLFSLASQALRACEARALHARKTLTPRFTDFFYDFEKKNPTVLQSKKYSGVYEFTSDQSIGWFLQLLNFSFYLGLVTC